MKKALLLALLGLAAPLCAQTLTTYTGTVRDLTGNAVTSGRITWQLNAPSGGNIPGRGAFVASIVSCLINSSGAPVSSVDGTSPCTVTNNSALSPTGTSYKMCIQPKNVTPGSCRVTYANGGSVDISTVVPTPDTQPNYGVASTGLANTWTQKQTFTSASFAGPLTIGPYATLGVNTYSDLQNALTACSTFPCSIHITSTVVLPGGLSIPSNVSLFFEGGMIQIPVGSVLSVAGPIFAGATQQIFTGAGTVSGLSFVRPEWFGTMHLSTAVNALPTGGQVLLSAANYISDYPGTSGNSSCVQTPGIQFWGVQKPSFDSLSSPTKLQNGTVIQGTLCMMADRSEVHHLGVDCGSTISSGCSGLSALIMSNALSQASGITPIQSPVVDDIATLLPAATTAGHGALLENVYNLKADGIWTIGGVHGVALKGTQSVLKNVWGENHTSDCIILASNTYAPSGHDTISGTTCLSMTGSNETAVGVVVNVETGTYAGSTIPDVQISNTNCTNMNAGCVLALAQGTPTTSINGLNIVNTTVDGTSGVNSYGIGLYNATYNVNINTASIYNVGFGVFMSSGQTDTTISNVNGSNFTNDGMNLSGTNTIVENSTVRNATNYGFLVNGGQAQFINTQAANVTSGQAYGTASGGVIAPATTPFMSFGGGTDHMSVSGTAFGVNRDVLNGGIYNTGGYAYQYNHTSSTTAANDKWCMQVFNPSNSSINTSAFCVNGSAQPYFSLAPVSSGTATLVSGTVSVSTTYACTPSSTCNYSLTNCGPLGSAIGTLSVASVSAGSAFAINSYTSGGTVATGDTSKVCWRIN